jgi:hypothetical protein
LVREPPPCASTRPPAPAPAFPAGAGDFFSEGDVPHVEKPESLITHIADLRRRVFTLEAVGRSGFSGLKANALTTAAFYVAASTASWVNFNGEGPFSLTVTTGKRLVLIASAQVYLSVATGDGSIGILVDNESTPAIDAVSEVQGDGNTDEAGPAIIVKLYSDLTPGEHTFTMKVTASSTSTVQFTAPTIIALPIDG